MRRCRQRRASAAPPLLSFIAHASLAPQPRKGAFVVRVRGRDAPLVALLVRAAKRAATADTSRVGSVVSESLAFLFAQDLPRPFAQLRALDLDKAAADVVAAL